MSARSFIHNLPVSVLTDSYKAGHFMMYPDAKRMCAYGEFRAPFQDYKTRKRDTSDDRFVFYGIRYLMENFIGRQWTMDDVENADKFYKTHNAGNTPYPYPKDLFTKFVKENNGYFPVRIEALEEGTCTNVHCPVYQIWAEGAYARLVTFLETMLTQLWYPTTVATLSRRTKDVLADAFDKSVDDESRWLLESRLHDFGFRGCACVEMSVLGGTAHLLNFTGSDTMSAGYYAQFYLNGGKPVAQSIPATEHSVMTSWPNEKSAMTNMIKNFGGKNTVFSCVMDSYDYDMALDKVLSSVAELHKKTGGLMVLRPDSGDPTECVIKALRAAEKIFGAVKNKKGYKVTNNCSTIQGDGITYADIGVMLDAIMKEGYSAQSIAFGMGGGLLQKVDRDTMAFATKLNYIQYADGTERDVMKKPKTDSGKSSFPGILQVKREKGVNVIYPRGPNEKVDQKDNELKLIWESGPVKGHKWASFDAIKKKIDTDWPACPKNPKNVSQALEDKVAKWKSDFKKQYAVMLKSLEDESKEN